MISPTGACSPVSAVHTTVGGEVGELQVPANSARCHRFAHRPARPSAKRTLNAASVIGLRSASELLASLIDTAAVTTLLEAELIDQVAFTPRAEYAFRHPLIRTVAYESQLSRIVLSCTASWPRPSNRTTRNGPRSPSIWRLQAICVKLTTGTCAPARGCVRTVTSVQRGQAGGEHGTSRTGCRSTIPLVP